jgi:glutamate racemase
MHPIALFDSGIGGLSVLTHIRARLPGENLLYLADQAHVPYGLRSHAEIVQFCEGITRFFLAQQAKVIVIACNRASTVALTPLRECFPDVPFVGIDPAIKPAAQQTKTGKVGVLATVGTLESERYASLMARFAGDVSVWEDPCVGLVELIEAGQTDTPEVEQFLRRTLAPMLANGVDTLVLGCTHYPFIRPLLHHIAPHLTLIDPAPAVAQQTHRVLQQAQLLAPATTNGQITLLTTGPAAPFATLARQLIGYDGGVGTAVWHDSVLRYS